MREAGRKVLAGVQSLAVHAIFGVVFVYGLSLSPVRIEPRTPVAIQATVIDRQQVVAALEARREAETERLRDAARARREEDAARQPDAAAQDRARRAERERQAAAEQEAAREAAAREAAERARLAEAEVERRRAEEAADREERERSLAAERQRQLDEIRRQREAAEADRRRIEREQEALAAERRAQDEAEEQRLDAERREQLFDREALSLAQAGEASLEQQWVAAIRAIVTQNWRRPPTARPGTRCMVRVEQLPGGEVLSAVVLPGCEVDEITRRSIIDAVRRSEPLPYKGFESVFKRRLTFEFVSGDR